jgi:hypothetical protein
MRVAARVGEEKAELSAVTPQPAECRRAGKIFVEFRATAATKIECPAGMMFAKSGGGDEPQDIRKHDATREFCANDRRLSPNTTEAGKRQQLDPVASRRRAQTPPCDGSRWSQPNHATFGRSADDDEPSRFPLQPQPAAFRVVGRDAKSAMERGAAGRIR